MIWFYFGSKNLDKFRVKRSEYEYKEYTVENKRKNSIKAVLIIAIYILVLYQTYTLFKRELLLQRLLRLQSLSNTYPSLEISAYNMITSATARFSCRWLFLLRFELRLFFYNIEKIL